MIHVQNFDRESACNLESQVIIVNLQNKNFTAGTFCIAPYFLNLDKAQFMDFKERKKLDISHNPQCLIPGWTYIIQMEIKITCVDTKICIMT